MTERELPQVQAAKIGFLKSLWRDATAWCTVMRFVKSYVSIQVYSE